MEDGKVIGEKHRLRILVLSVRTNSNLTLNIKAEVMGVRKDEGWRSVERRVD